MHTSPKSEFRCQTLCLIALLASWPIAAHGQSSIRFAPQGTPIDDSLLLMVPEAVGTIDLPVDREGDLSSAAHVRYQVTGESALAGFDFSTMLGAIRFEPGESRKVLPLEILTDTEPEETEYLEVLLFEPSEGTAVTVPFRIRVGILDAQTGLQIDPEQHVVAEANTELEITVRLPKIYENLVTVDYATGEGTATANLDFTAISGTLSFAPGEQSKIVNVPLLNDALSEGSEWFQLILNNPTGGAHLGSPRTSTIRIVDNDPGIEFTSSAPLVSEAAGQVTLTVRRGNDSPDTFTVDFATEAISAAVGADFESASGTLTFGPNDHIKSIVIPILNDAAREGTEVFRVVLSNPTPGFSLGKVTTCHVYLEDNDPGIGFTQANNSVSEATATITLTVQRGNDLLLGPFTVDYATRGAAATAGADFESTSGTLSFAEGEVIRSIVIPILNDALAEGLEDFHVELSNPSSGFDTGNLAFAQVRIEDNDEGVSFTQDQLVVPETAGPITLTVQRGNDLPEAFTVDFATEAISAAGGTDFEPVSGTLAFGPTDQTKSIAIQILNDGVQEGTEIFLVILSNPTPGFSLGRVTTCPFYIEDNDPGIGFTQSTHWISEAAGSVTLTVQRGNDLLLGPSTVDYVTSPGSATAGLDYQTSTGTLTFGEGEIAKDLTIAILNDGLREESEYFQVRLVDPTGDVSLGSNASAQITIEDNDPGIGFTQSDQWTSEAEGSVTLTVQRGNDLLLGAFTVDYATSPGSATAGLDYQTSTGTLTFGEGETIKDLTIPILNDGLREESEYFQVRLVDPTGDLSLGLNASAQITITDNDPGIGFTQSDQWTSEAAGSVTLTVQRGNDLLLGAFTVDYATSPGNATAGLDYQTSTGTLTFGEGETTKELTIPILNDGLREESESFRVALLNPTGGLSLGSNASAQITIDDNDPGIGFTQSEHWTSEAAGSVTLTFQRGNDLLLGAFTVDYVTYPGSATAGSDFETTAGTLAFAEGDLTRIITIPILNDGQREESESFRVGLRNPTGGFGLSWTAEAQIHLEDNDRGVAWASTWYSIHEAAGALRATVRRGNDVDLAPMIVEYQLIGQSATLGLDVAGEGGTLRFAEGDSEAQLEIQILNDALREEPERFEIRLLTTSSPLGFGQETLATVEIQDNDPGAGFKDWGWEATEESGLIELTIVRGNDVDLGPMSVDYLLLPQSAQPHTDYVEASGTITFNPGEIEQTLTVGLREDLEWEGDEEFQVILTNHTGGGTLNSYPVATIRILDDDPVTWDLIQRFPDAWNFRDLAAGNGLWVIPVDGPAILWSTNGTDWSSEPVEPYFVCVGYGSDRFLGITDLGHVFTSTNGIDWEAAGSVPTGGNWPEQVIYGNDQFLVLEGDGRTWVSADGQSWSPGVLPQAGWVRAVTCGAGLYLAVTDQGKALLSTDGLDWTVEPALPSGSLTAVAYGDGHFVAVGNAPDPTGNWRPVMIRSTDGQTWILQWLPDELSASDLAFGHGRFVAVHESSYYNGGATIWTLTPGAADWQIERVSNLSARSVAFDGARFVAIHGYGVMVSEDGLTWNDLASDWKEIVHADGLFVLGTESTTGWTANYSIVTSPDLEHWTERVSGSGPMRELAVWGDRFHAVVGGQSGWYASTPARLLRSTEGIDWETIGLDFDGQINDALCDNATIIAVGQRGYRVSSAMIWTSTDGEAWTAIDLFARGSLYTVRPTTEGYRVAGDQWDIGQVQYQSPDGLVWEQTSDPQDFRPKESEQLIALQVGADDGRFWLKRADQPWLGYLLPGGAAVRDVICVDGRLIAVGDRGALWRSSPLIQLELPKPWIGPQGELQWTLAVWGPPGARYALQSTPDLVTWTTLDTVMAVHERTELALPAPLPGDARHYRVVMLPDSVP
jgi:hypothetical protein